MSLPAFQTAGDNDLHKQDYRTYHEKLQNKLVHSGKHSLKHIYEEGDLSELYLDALYDIGLCGK